MQAINWTDFFIIFICCACTILASRVLPLFILKGRSLPKRLEEALGFIPSAAFAALVANDLFSPGMFDAGMWPALAPLLASLAVVIVARLSKSLLCCALAGVCAYGMLIYLV